MTMTRPQPIILRIAARDEPESVINISGVSIFETGVIDLRPLTNVQTMSTEKIALVRTVKLRPAAMALLTVSKVESARIRMLMWVAIQTMRIADSFDSGITRQSARSGASTASARPRTKLI